MHYYKAVSEEEIPLGDVKVSFSFVFDETTKNARVTLYVDDRAVGSTAVTELAYMVGFSSSLLANPYSPITSDYESPFEFTGRADKIVLHQYPSVIDPEEELKKLSSVE